MTGAELKALRKMFNLSQSDLSCATGISASTIRQVEGGKVTNLRKFTEEKLRRFFDERIRNSATPEEELPVARRETRPKHLPSAVWLDLEMLEDNVRTIREQLNHAAIPQDFWMVRNHLSAAAGSLSSLTWRVSEHQLKEPECKP